MGKGRLKLIPERHQLFRRFRVALLLDEAGGRSMSVQRWAEDKGVIASHVYHVMEGHASSDRIEYLMTAYVTEVFAAHRVSIGTDSGPASA